LSAASPLPALSPDFLALPKAELHLHLEGSLQPATVSALAARHGANVPPEEVQQRYAYQDFLGFIEAFKWVSAFLREPQDYGLALRDLGQQLLAQNVVYAEITLSVGVMLLRKQSPEKNFQALLAVAEMMGARGLQMNFVFDAVRQFGAEAAMQVVEAAGRTDSEKIVAFGIGGDELSIPAKEFRNVYELAGSLGLHKLMHAGEIGGPKEIRDAIEILGVERIGHGIAAFRDPALMDLLAERRIALEICPGSNLKTGALAKQLGNPDATLQEHPLPLLLRHGIPVVLSTDDPPMFHTNLLQEYRSCLQMGLNEDELKHMAAASFEHSFSADKIPPQPML
jgi:aminodeoxyfutalosine deaminase